MKDKCCYCLAVEAQTAIVYADTDGSQEPVCWNCIEHLFGDCIDAECAICPADCGTTLEEGLAWAESLGLGIEIKGE